MNTEKVLLSQVKVNTANPRTITERKLWLLVERLLAFPKMISIRPIVVNEKMVALGGNMRLRAYGQIAQLHIKDIRQKLAGTQNYKRMTDVEKDNLIKYWEKWLDKPTIEVVKASELTEAEQQEFIIADNASFGEWDYDKLANEWEAEDLNSWGLDVWAPEPPQSGGGASGQNAAALAEAESSGEGEKPFDPSGLPPELQGQDINPDDLPKIEGSNETAMERVIIVYPKERVAAVAQLLGLEKIEKVVYSIKEILPDEKGE